MVRFSYKKVIKNQGNNSVFVIYVRNLMEIQIYLYEKNIIPESRILSFRGLGTKRKLIWYFLHIRELGHIKDKVKLHNLR